MVCCIVGFAYAQQFLVQASAASCNMFQFLYDAAEGQPTTTPVPKWIGLNGVNKLIDDTLVQIDVLNSKSANTFKNVNDNWTTADPNKLSGLLDNILSKNNLKYLF